LKGISSKIFIFLIKNIKNRNKLITEKISIPDMASIVDEKVDSCKKSLKRMKGKKILKTIESQGSYSGFSQYQIDKNHLFFLLQ
jgi:hypothetical protein